MQKNNWKERPKNLGLSKEIRKATQKRFELNIDSTIRPGEIILAEITFLYKRHQCVVKEIYKKPTTGENFDNYFQKIFLKRTKSDVHSIISIKMIKRLGFENVLNQYSEVKRSEETRDKNGNYV